MANDVLRLPTYPSTPSRATLPASQRAKLYQTIASTLSVVLALPPQKRDIPSTREYLSSYVQDTAFQTLQNLIWRDESAEEGNDERLIAKRSLMLAEKLAQSPQGIDIQILLDLSVAYSRTSPSHVRSVFKAAYETRPELATVVADDLIPGFTALLSQQTPASQGLYAQRKISACILAFLRGAKGTPELLRPFTRSKPFLLALAALYDTGMTAIATSWGGINALSGSIAGRDADEWEMIWVETKVALLDAFHVVLGALLDGLATSPAGVQLAAEAERTFDVIFALLESPSSSSGAGPRTPFLDQSLLADYQQAYSLSKTLAAALRHAQEKDVRLDLLESALSEFDGAGAYSGGRKPGALKIILRSSGIQPGIDNLGTRNRRGPPPPPASPPPLPDLKGKARAAPPPEVPSDPDLDIKATQVLDILPDTPVEYVKRLLAHDRYGRNPESVIEALLEGTALSEDELAQAAGEDHFDISNAAHNTYDVTMRRNVFDEEDIDVTRLHIGKASQGEEVLRDRTFIEEMKADILRRAEALSEEEEEEEEVDFFGKGKTKESTGAPKVLDLGPEEDEGAGVALRIAGDGEDSGDEDDEEDGKPDEVQTPETILELAYLRDPKLFDRDAETRRSKARTDLRAQTGYDNEQIEGWRIMLERNPIRKAKLAETHEFRGNEKGLDVRAGGGGGRGRGGPRGGRGRGGGGAGGRGGGGGGGAGGGAESSARERAWKDKNKASRGNHNRKRGHDKKMARAGPVAGPSA